MNIAKTLKCFLKAGKIDFSKVQVQVTRRAFYEYMKGKAARFIVILVQRCIFM